MQNCIRANPMLKVTIFPGGNHVENKWSHSSLLTSRTFSRIQTELTRSKTTRAEPKTNLGGLLQGKSKGLSQKGRIIVFIPAVIPDHKHSGWYADLSFSYYLP